MSDSDSDDFGTLGPTTPLVPVKRKVARPNNAINQAVSGPSSRPTSRAAKAKSSGHSDIEELKYTDDYEDVEGLQQTRRRKPSSRSEVTKANGKQPVAGKGTAKGKGKATADPPRAIAPTPELVDVDDIQIIEDTNAAIRGPRAVNASKNKRSSATTFRPAPNDNASKELERCRRKAADAEAQIAALSNQLEESFRVRDTESETLLKRQAVQYESQIQTLEELVKELNSQLARTEPLTRSGKSSVLHLLTRETSDEEKRLIEKELGRWKDVSKEKDDIIMGKDRRIAELEQLEEDLRFELRAEIDRSSALASKATRHPPSATRGRTGHGLVVDDPKQVQIIKFYEDLTNLLVPSMRVLPAKDSGLDEWTFTCIYTYVDVDNTSINDHDERTGKSLNFTLCFCYDGEPEPRSVHYTPLELDKESAEFVEKLDFLGTSFTFKREQLSLFFKTVYSKMGGESQTNEDGSERDGSEQILDGQEVEDEDMDDIQIIDR